LFTSERPAVPVSVLAIFFAQFMLLGAEPTPGMTALSMNIDFKLL
jgi:hypothetical protein